MTNRINYRIYTEDTGIAFTPIIKRYFDGATLATVHGLWRGHVEYSAVIEIVANDTREDREKIAGLASEIAIKANQDTVMVTETPITVHMFGKTTEILHAA